MASARGDHRIATGDVEIDVAIVPQDSEIFGFRVAAIDRIEVRGVGEAGVAGDELRAWFDREDVRLASCRLRSDRLHESMWLEANGFRFVEMVYRPVLSPISLTGIDDTSISIARAERNDLAAIEAIAGSTFRTGRFFLDWRLSPEASDRRYRTWVRTSFEHPRQQILKASLASEQAIAGFFIVEHRDDGSVYWHLTALAPDHQGRGLGKRVWSAMASHHRGEGAERIETTISGHNVSVMNVYAALGFRFGSPQATFHWVRA